VTASWDWAKGLRRWKAHEGEDGRRYDLTHLDPKRFTVTLPAKPGYEAVQIEIRVGYMSHAFSKGCLDNCQPHAEYSGEGDPRVFCPERYALSLRLPDFINAIGDKSCYESNHRNGSHFVVENVEGLPQGCEYWVFLEMVRVEDRVVRLRVRSAYVGERNRAPRARGGQSVRFRQWLSRTLGLHKKKS
jgi:hypothetical protein